MYFFAALMISIAALTVALAPIEMEVREQPTDVYTAQAEVDNYRTFAYAVAVYLKYNPTYTGTLTWPVVKTSTQLGEGQRNATLPASWKAVVASSTDYVLCTEMSELAAGSIGQLFPDLGAPVFLTSANALVVPTATGMTSSQAATEAAKCT